MKLKNVLVLTFLTLTLIPIIVASLLLYNSGYNLSKESYTRNLVESINVQVDYITQTIENNMIADYRFANRRDVLLADTDDSSGVPEKDLFTAFGSYLESSEDKITVCILMDKEDNPIYTIGEKRALNIVRAQLPKLSTMKKQTLSEFELDEGTYSLGIITPVWDNNGTYSGSLVSIYDKAYIFKIISSYYKVADSSTYICRENGDIISLKSLSDRQADATIVQALEESTFASDGVLDIHINNIDASGYYKNINNSPWYLVGIIDDNLIYSFTNKFVLGYILIIICVLIADVILSFYFSRKVVEPINGLIKVMEGYKNSLNSNDLQYHEKNGYYEMQYLRTEFLGLMKAVLLAQHNFEGVYQLYQSNDMDDTNIDIDTRNQTIASNKEAFQQLMSELIVPKGACIVEKFTNCFCEKDQILLAEMFENMRDEHLSIAREAELYTPHMGRKWFHTLVVPMYENDRLSHLFIQLRDISGFKKQEHESAEQARRDGLTGLLNRLGFSECVDRILKTDGTSELHGLLFVDIDFFKMVNDNFGHSAGDDLLRTVSSLLMATIGPDDLAARFGGDEFVVFLAHTSMEVIAEIKEKLSKSMIYEYHTDQRSFVVSASIGVSTWSHASPDTLENLLKSADLAMYEAKREFKKRVNCGDTE